jgi:hypothetical protein
MGQEGQIRSIAKTNYWVIDDHYAVCLYVSKKMKRIAKVYVRGYPDVFHKIQVENNIYIDAIDEKWAMFYNLIGSGTDEMPLHPFGLKDGYKYIEWQCNIIVVNAENAAVCPGSIDDFWNVSRFKKQLNTRQSYTQHV